MLDEATSSLDGITERIVTDAIQRLSGEMTIIVIAERLGVAVEQCQPIVETLIEAGLLTGDA